MTEDAVLYYDADADEITCTDCISIDGTTEWVVEYEPSPTYTYSKKQENLMTWETYETASALLGGWTVLLVALMVLVVGIVRKYMAPSLTDCPEEPMICVGAIAATVASVGLFLTSPLSRIPLALMVAFGGTAGCTLALWAPVKARLCKKH